MGQKEGCGGGLDVTAGIHDGTYRLLLILSLSLLFNSHHFATAFTIDRDLSDILFDNDASGGKVEDDMKNGEDGTEMSRNNNRFLADRWNQLLQTTYEKNADIYNNLLQSPVNRLLMFDPDYMRTTEGRTKPMYKRKNERINGVYISINECILPANTKHLYNSCTMLDERRRRWAEVVKMLYKCFVIAGNKVKYFLRNSSLTPDNKTNS